MDLKKFLDQTVREVKREVNKKVLKVPEIEQKVYEATSNEPWGPHGTLMGEIAQATRNFQEYQMIMSILWKRLNDTGKNWRHVYKALTLLEFLVANGAERIIDELREHSYQVQTLSDFQYVEAGGKDQGLNVRKKAQTLVSLLSDKDRIREVRSKAAANRDKYRGVSSYGSFARAASYSSTGGGYSDRDYDDDRHGSREGDRYGDRDSDRYRDDRYKDEDRYRDDRDRDRYEDDRYGSRGGDAQSNGKYGDDSRNGSSSYGRDRDRYGSFEDDDSSSRRGNGSASGSKADDYSQDDREQSGLAAAVARAHTSQSNQTQSSSSTTQTVERKTTPTVGGSYFATQAVADDPDDFDPRGSGAASSSRHEDDPFATSTTAAPAPVSLPLPSAGPAKTTSGIEDLFGDGGFETSFTAAPPVVSEASGSAQVNSSQDEDLFGSGAFSVESFNAAPSFSASSTQFLPPGVPVNGSVNGNFQSFAPLDPSGSFDSSSTTFSSQPPAATQSNFPPPAAPFPSQTSFPPQPAYASTNFPPSAYTNTNFPPAAAPIPRQTSFPLQPTSIPGQTGFPSSSYTPGQKSFPPSSGTPSQTSFEPQGTFGASSFGSSSKVTGPSSLESVSTGVASQPQKPPQKPFQPKKSSIWSDTISSGLIDLNISGPKTNPLAELGIDLKDSIFSVQEKRKEEVAKPTASSMGRAMGSGTGLGLAGAGVIGPPGPIMGGMNMGMGAGPQSMGMGLGMGGPPGYGGAPGMGSNVGYGLNAGMGAAPGYGVPAGMGMGPNLGMNGGMGGFGMSQGGYGGLSGYPNQQYSGFR